MAATYTVKQVASILGYSTNSIYTFLKEKRIKGIRVGRGRFRIPQAELDRLLQTKRGNTPSVDGTPPDGQAYLDAAQTNQSPTALIHRTDQSIIATLAGDMGSARVNVPNLFDWFVGIASIVLGFSMFLFTATFEEFAVAKYLVWLGPIRATLISAGLGILFSDITRRAQTWWHKLFSAMLASAYFGYVIILWQVGHTDGLVLFGLLALFVIANLVFTVQGTASLALYVGLIAILMPGVLLVLPTALPLPETIHALANQRIVIAGIIVVLASSFCGLLWWGYQKHRMVFWTLMAVVAGMLIGLSFWYATSLHWGRSLFVLLLGLTTLIIPTWDSLHFSHRYDRRLVFSAFGGILILFLSAIMLIHLLQLNLFEYAQSQLANKVTYGRTIVASTLESSQATLESAVSNGLLSNVVEKKDTEVATGLLRNIFEGSGYFRRVLTLDEKGDVLAVYPYDVSLEGKNFAYRDYFIQPTTTKKTYISDIFQAESTGRPFVIAISVPIVGKEKQVAGILVGSVDLLSLNRKLQSVATAQMDEYFMVVDSRGMRVIHPDPTLISTEVDVTNPVRRALGGSGGIDNAYTFAGVRSIQAYDSIPKVKWGIAIQAPVTSVLRATGAASVAIFIVMVVAIGIIVGFWILHRTWSLRARPSR